jgi:hypothetical protein
VKNGCISGCTVDKERIGEKRQGQFKDSFIQYYFETKVHQHSGIVNIPSRYGSILLPQQLNQILWYIQNEKMLPANLIDDRKR